jgi:ribosomal-protein-alanine N-acetyltransferase
MAFSKFEISRMVGEDLDEVMKIEEMSFSSPWSRGMFLTELKDNPFSTLLTAKVIHSRGETEETNLVGYCCFWIVFGEVHIMNLAVHPDWRRKGIGTRLVEEAISISRRHEVQKIHLEVRRSNDSARKLYEKFGFKVIAVRPNYYTQPREDALLMALELK